MKKIITWLMLLPFFLMSKVTLAQSDTRSMYEDALEQFKQGNYSYVLRQCDELTRRLDKLLDADIWRLKAQTNYALGNFEQAARDYNTAEKSTRINPVIYYESGTVNMCLGRFDVAEVEFANASRVFRERKSPGGNDFVIYQEDYGKANQYNNKYRQAINAFNEAIRMGSLGAYINLMSCQLQTNNLPALKFNADSLLGAKDFPLLQDEVFYNYISALSDLGASNISDVTLGRINAALNNYRGDNTSCFHGLYYDLLYARGLVYQALHQDTLAFRQFKEIFKANPNLTEVGLKVKNLKTQLGIDAQPPVIVMANPEMNEHDAVTFEASTNKISKDFYIKVTDSSGSGVSAITVNNKPIALKSLDVDGIFIFSMPVYAGQVNEVNITAIDKEDNRNDMKYTVSLEEKARSASDINPDDEVPEITTETTYHALLIAENEYADAGFTRLDNPVNDANELKEILVTNYEFEEKNVTVLINPSRQAILDSMDKFCRSKTDADNLLVFYAGHGEAYKLKDTIMGGFIIPSDAVKGNKSTYLSNVELLSSVRNSYARHILFIVDACFAGALNKTRTSVEDVPEGLKSLFRAKSRYILTSGNLEEVADNSLFMSNMKHFLRTKPEPYFSALDLYSYINSNNGNSPSLPQFDKIQNTGDVGGKFIFKRREVGVKKD